MVSCGAKHSLYQSFQQLLQSGDEVIVFSPYWFCYCDQVKLAHGVPVAVPVSEADAFQPDIAAVRRAITAKTKAIIVNSPCNPTGAVFDRAVLERLGKLACERGLFVIADEVYEKIVFDGARHCSMAALDADFAARTITINSVSKTHSMTGWRIGYAAMPAELAQKVTYLQSMSTSGPCAIAQRAALAALTGDQAHVDAMVADYRQRRDYLLGRISRIGSLSCFEPRGTFYLFVNVSGLFGRTLGGVEMLNAASVADAFAKGLAIQVTGGAAAFGSDRHVRISFAASMKDLEEAMDRMERHL